MRQFWSRREVSQLRALYPHQRSAEVAAILGHPISAIYGMAAKLGLKKSAEYLAGPEACRLRRGDNIGTAFRFKPGHAPANKGLRRPGWSPGRMAETQFKKGERSGIAAKNWRPIGAILPDSEGYLRIKVREAEYGKEPTGFGNVRVWPLLHRQVYKREYGPIPAGHIVVFKDRNRANCDPANLELITLAENMRRNTIHRRLLPELKAATYALIALKRKLTLMEKPHEKHTC